jgi:hypothetical protein
MRLISQTYRIIGSPLTAILVGVVAGLPLVCLASQNSPDVVPLMQSEEAADSEVGAFESDYSEVFAMFQDVDDFAPSAYTYRVADGLTQTDFALAESHLQRGPPGC